MVDNNEMFDPEFLINGLREIDPVIFYKDTEARYVFSNHHKQKTKYDTGHMWDIYGMTDLDCRDDKENAKFVYEFDLRMMKTGEKGKYIIEMPRDGKIAYLEVEKSPIYKDGKVIGIVGLIVDITEKVELKQQLEKMANTDQLTGLYNRNYFCSWLEKENNEKLYPLSILSADCNYLKYMNDTYGHFTGDTYIKMMSDLLNKVLPENSVIFRMGGDEFLAIMPNTKKEEGLKIIEKLNIISKEFVIMNQELSASYGLSTVENYTKGLEEYLHEADQNMYKEKEKVHALKK